MEGTTGERKVSKAFQTHMRLTTLIWMSFLTPQPPIVVLEQVRSIQGVRAHEILDSRGNPTVQASAFTVETHTQIEFNRNNAS